MNMTEGIILAAKGHDGQTRKDGSPYIYHPLKVALALKEKGYDERFQMAGLFHDLLEDTDVSKEEILALSDEEVLKAVELLTKEKGYRENEYIDAILLNPIAKAVKAEDRIYNLNDAANLDENHLKFIEKYLKETETFFLGRFSEEVDEAYYKLKARRDFLIQQ